MRVLLLIGIFFAGEGAWYWKHLQGQDQRGVAYFISPDYAANLLSGFSIILTNTVMFIAWREMFPGKRKTKNLEHSEISADRKPTEPNA